MADSYGGAEWAKTRERTHYVGCWRIHHDCAVALLERIVGGQIEVYHDDQGHPRIRTTCDCQCHENGGPVSQCCTHPERFWPEAAP